MRLLLLILCNFVAEIDNKWKKKLLIIEDSNYSRWKVAKVVPALRGSSYDRVKTCLINL